MFVLTGTYTHTETGLKSGNLVTPTACLFWFWNTFPWPFMIIKATSSFLLEEDPRQMSRYNHQRTASQLEDLPTFSPSPRTGLEPTRWGAKQSEELQNRRLYHDAKGAPLVDWEGFIQNYNIFSSFDTLFFMFCEIYKNCRIYLTEKNNNINRCS